MSMPDLIVEVAFSTGAGLGSLLQLDDPSRGLLDTGTLGTGTSEDPVWVDITEWVQSGSTTRGANRIDNPIIQYEAGTCSIVLDNSDRRFDPSYLDGPYVDPLNGTTQVTAMRAMRVRVVWDGSTYEIFRGFVDTWDVQWIGETYSECTMTATDAFKVLAGIDRPALAVPVGAGESSGDRITRILDSVGWPAVDRAVQSGSGTVQATDLSGDALAELQLVTQSELGELYGGGNGKIQFNGRLQLVEETRSNTSQATFGDGGGAELPYQELTIATDDATFYNQVRVTAAGSSNEQLVEDATSQTLYYIKTYKPGADPIVETDADALGYAQWLLYVSREPETRFVSIGINPRRQPDDLYPQVLVRRLADRITVIRRPPGGGDPADTDCFIRGIQHEFSPASWKTTWTLQSADKYGNFLVLDHAQLGQLDGAALAY